MSGNKNHGHGHVNPRPDGLRARCGGPGLCADCTKEAAIKNNQAIESKNLALSLVAAGKAERQKEPNWDEIGREISEVINRHSLDNYLSTPDFMLSDLVLQSLKLHREFLIERKKWLGDSPVVGENFGGAI